MVLQLVPEPLPPLSAASHDEELDVTLDPECAAEGEEPDAPVTETPGGQPIREQHVRSAVTGRDDDDVLSCVWQILVDGL